MRETPIIHAPADLAHWIDHTILAPEATEAAVEKLCREAVTHRFRSVCVNPIHARFVAAGLRGSGVKTCSETVSGSVCREAILWYSGRVARRPFG